MASTAEVQEIVLLPMRALYRTPFGVESVEDALTEYGKVLRRFDPDHLERGWERITLSHKRRDWPSLAEIREAVEAMKPLPKKAPAAKPPSEFDDERTPEEKARVNRLFDIWHRNSESWADAAADPEYKEMLGEFLRREDLPMLPIEFRDRAFQFINRNRQTKQDFKDAGVTTMHTECVLYFRDEDAVRRIREWYGAQISEFVGFYVRLAVEPPETEKTKWVHPRWDQTETHWSPKPPLFVSTPYLARDLKVSAA